MWRRWYPPPSRGSRRPRWSFRLTCRPSSSIYSPSRRRFHSRPEEENAMKPFRTMLVGALTVLLITTPAWAQLSTAQLSGRITDESGAVLPGVTVTAIQTDTGLTRSVVTDADGTYLLPNLP